MVPRTRKHRRANNNVVPVYNSNSNNAEFNVARRMNALSNSPKHFFRSKPMTVRRINKRLPNAQHATFSTVHPVVSHANTFAPTRHTALAAPSAMKAKPHLTKRNLLRNTGTRHLNI